MTLPGCLESRTFVINALAAAHPPVWSHPHKSAIYTWLQQKSPQPSGQIEYSRWATCPLPGRVDGNTCQVTCTPHFYTYPISANHAWHVNFADPRLFAAYGSALLAQDELQVLEHPLLGSLRQALLAEDHAPLTRENGRSTPVLITGIPRQCALNVSGEPTSTSNKAGPWWKRLLSYSKSRSSQPLYGNRFQQARIEEVMCMLTVLNPPTWTNLIAIAAPTGNGRYTGSQITDILETAFTGMLAAKLLSRRIVPDKPVAIHTGWWGCGAFGGNRQIMAMLQVLAARMAGIDHLIFHAGDSAHKFDFEEALNNLNLLQAEHSPELPILLKAIEAQDFAWGCPDGN